MSCEQFLYLDISCEYDFIMLILGKNIYITINNISIFRKRFYPDDILDILYIMFLLI